MTRKLVKLEEWIEAARNLYQKEGEIEIDDNAQLSSNDDPHTSHGCYVQAWVWVSTLTSQNSEEARGGQHEYNNEILHLRPLTESGAFRS